MERHSQGLADVTRLVCLFAICKPLDLLQLFLQSRQHGQNAPT